VHSKTNTSNIIFDEQNAVLLRQLAADLGFFITRGPGSGTMGNIKGLMMALGKAYAQNNLATTDTMKKLVSNYKSD